MYNTIRYMIFKYGLESVLILRIYNQFWSHTGKNIIFFNQDPNRAAVTRRKMLNWTLTTTSLMTSPKSWRKSQLLLSRNPPPPPPKSLPPPKNPPNQSRQKRLRWKPTWDVSRDIETSLIRGRDTSTLSLEYPMLKPRLESAVSRRRYRWQHTKVMRLLDSVQNALRSRLMVRRGSSLLAPRIVCSSIYSHPRWHKIRQGYYYYSLEYCF